MCNKCRSKCDDRYELWCICAGVGGRISKYFKVEASRGQKIMYYVPRGLLKWNLGKGSNTTLMLSASQYHVPRV